MNTLQKFKHFETIGFVGLSTLFDWQSHAEQGYILSCIENLLVENPDLTDVNPDHFFTGWIEADTYYWELDQWQDDTSTDLWYYIGSNYRYNKVGTLDSEQDFNEMQYLQYQSRHDTAIELMWAIVNLEVYYLVFENQAGYLPVPDDDIDCYSVDDAKDAMWNLIEDYFVEQRTTYPFNTSPHFNAVQTALALKNILALTPDESIEIQIDETVFNLVCKEL